VQITSQSNALLTFTLLNSGLKQSSGSFGGLRGGMYHFRVEDATGCSKDTLVIITEKIPIGGCDTIFIPNAFTPNNDGKNDRYIVDLPSTYKDMVLQIFNRWGTIVYQEKGNSVSWDGSYKGIQQPPGVYIYSLRYTGRDNARKILKGTLTLIR
jgi:gliding motility-associated-like protein